MTLGTLINLNQTFSARRSLNPVIFHSICTGAHSLTTPAIVYLVHVRNWIKMFVFKWIVPRDDYFFECPKNQISTFCMIADDFHNIWLPFWGENLNKVPACLYEITY